ncbi:MAG TPA: SDR family oxidoreductase [Acidocella sp.]|nr:MAG: NAD(P)-dependent oxidoreductase [Acidocella sp. 20-61-6]HQT47018.1 SDR family oxidoreductase [Acidocella sp.]
MREDAGRLLVFGLGYSGQAIALAARVAGFEVLVTSRRDVAGAAVEVVPFAAAQGAVAWATHIVATAAPDAQGDPVLACYEAEIRAAQALRWVGYLSTTGVYGNRDGDWVDEGTAPMPGSERARRRVMAEAQWAALPVAVDVFRLAGIYGPGRSMFDDLRAGEARHVVKPGHLFGRIHRDDIAQGVVAAMRQVVPPGLRIFNFSDDVPAASAEVVCEAARLLGVAPPEPVDFEAARKRMSPMALSFWAENRRVGNAQTKATLGFAWKYPSYREGLRAILAEEHLQAAGQQSQV